MKRILGNLRAYWQYLGGAFLLFLIQMYCICGIADSIYGLKNTGADSQGMEFALATALPYDAFGQAGMYMTAAELADWQNSYQLEEDGLYHLKKSFQMQDKLQEMEEEFLIPQAVAWRASRQEKSSVGENEEMDDIFVTGEDAVRIEIPEDPMEVRDTLEIQMEAEGKNVVRNEALAFVHKHSSEAGVDLAAIKSGYVLNAVFRIVFSLFVLAAVTLVICNTIDKTMTLIRKRMDEPDVRDAQQMLVFLVYGAAQAAADVFMVQIRTEQYHGGILPQLFAGMALAAGLLVVYFLYRNPAWEGFRTKISFMAGKRQKYFNRLRHLMLLVMPALFLFAAAFSFISMQILHGIMLGSAVLYIGLSALLLPELAEMSDYVESDFREGC